MKLPFFQTHICQSGRFCRRCRDREGGRPYRRGWSIGHDCGPGGEDFACARLGLQFEGEAGADGQAYPAVVPPPAPAAAPAAAIEPNGTVLDAVITAAGVKYERRPRPTLSKAAAWALAATLGRYVGPDVIAARSAACGGCALARRDAKGMWCGACGCAVAPDGARLANLAAYVENIPGLPDFNPQWPTWGCKHPERGQLKAPGDASKGRHGWPLPVISE